MSDQTTLLLGFVFALFLTCYFGFHFFFLLFLGKRINARVVAYDTTMFLFIIPIKMVVLGYEYKGNWYEELASVTVMSNDSNLPKDRIGKRVRVRILRTHPSVLLSHFGSSLFAGFIFISLTIGFYFSYVHTYSDDLLLLDRLIYIVPAVSVLLWFCMVFFIKRKR